MRTRLRLPVVRTKDEVYRQWQGDEGKPLPRCPSTFKEKCEPSICRLMEFHCVRCKKWRMFCFGHSESSECISCAEEIEEKILKYVRESKRGYRRESRIRYFLAGTNDVVGGTGVEPTLDYARIDDILFELVQDKKLEWVEDAAVGEASRGEEDLKYRIPTKEPLLNDQKVRSISIPRKRKLDPTRQAAGVGTRRRMPRAR